MKFARSGLWLVMLFAFVTTSGRTWYGKNVETWAACKDPVVDLCVNLPVQQRCSLSGMGYADGKCRRSHQLLFNEVVRVVERKGQHVKIACDNLIYGFDEQTQGPLNTFWVHKKHLLFFSHLDDAALTAFPAPQGNIHTLILRFPWKHYSLATRFVRAPEHDTEKSYGALIVTSHPHTIKVIDIPKSHARVETALTAQQQRAYFVKLAYAIIAHAQRQGNDKIIPYVWGGSSYIGSYTDGDFYLQDKQWERPGKHNPYNGFDCSELVFRLAQVSGIPYVCKTTVVIEKLMRPLKKTDRLEPGDLIRFPGHVMIVGNLARNELIEACGYGGGFGRIHVIPLSKRFGGIQNYKQLLQAYHNKKQLMLLAKDGSDQSLIKEFKLYKLV